MIEQTQQRQTASLLASMAEQYGIEPNRFKDALTKSVLKFSISNEDLMAFCVIARKYKLNPFTREIYAFPAKEGGVSIVVGIDGWLSIINSQPQFDGMKVDVAADGNEATCTIYRKDRAHPISVTEYYTECYREKSPAWKQFPKRMLRHKAIMQCARVAFGISGIADEDEGRDIAEAEPKKTVTRVVGNASIDPFLNDEMEKLIADSYIDIESTDE